MSGCGCFPVNLDRSRRGSFKFSKRSSSSGIYMIFNVFFFDAHFRIWFFQIFKLCFLDFRFDPLCFLK